MNPSYQTLDAALRHVIVSERVRKGHSQVSFAHAIGVSRQYLNRYELAQRSFGMGSLVRIARALRMPLSQLVAKAEEMLTDA
jgi:transcriptional regulator with XRE-family HTH domain